MKLLFTEGVGATQTTTNAQDEKIKIFASEEDMLDNIDTLEDNEIVATNDATEADLIGNILTEIAALKEQLNGMTPRISDFANISTLDVGAASGVLYDFTADEDCFVAISQQWSTGTDVSAWCHLYDADDNILAYDGYSGYGLTNAYTVLAGFIFVPKGETIKYSFTQGSGYPQNPKILVRTK